jgi:hypothetical protein
MSELSDDISCFFLRLLGLFENKAPPQGRCFSRIEDLHPNLSRARVQPEVGVARHLRAATMGPGPSPLQGAGMAHSETPNHVATDFTSPSLAIKSLESGHLQAINYKNLRDLAEFVL